MKKNVVSVLVFLMIAGAASAQTESGNWLIGGNLNLNTAKNSTQVGINPTVGYFFANNFAAGGTINFSHSRAGDNRSTTFGIGPFARYYFGSSMVRPLIHANVDFNSTKFKTPLDTHSENGTDFFVGAGLADFINRNVALEALAGYYHAAISGQEGSGGFNLRIGFQVYLSRHQIRNITK
jgi:hypothetical protein